MTEDDSKKAIATFNDIVEFYCGRKIFDPANVVWMEYFCRDSFDPKLFADSIREYFENGGNYDRDNIGPRIRWIYGRHIGEKKADYSGKCLCGGKKTVYVLTDRNEQVVNFKYGQLETIRDLRLNNVCCSPCPYCCEMTEGLAKAVKACCIPLTVEPGSKFLPPTMAPMGWVSGKEVIWEWIQYRLSSRQ